MSKELNEKRVKKIEEKLTDTDVGIQSKVRSKMEAETANLYII
jgi:hypothetical protein